MLLSLSSCNKESSIWQYIVNDGDEKDGEGMGEIGDSGSVPPNLPHTSTYHQNLTLDTKYYFFYIQLIIVIIKEQLLNDHTEINYSHYYSKSKGK